MSQEKLTPDQVQHERDRIETQHDDAMDAADGRREIQMKELRTKCRHAYANSDGWCPDCGSGGRGLS